VAQARIMRGHTAADATQVMHTPGADASRL